VLRFSTGKKRNEQDLALLNKVRSNILVCNCVFTLYTLLKKEDFGSCTKYQKCTIHASNKVSSRQYGLINVFHENLKKMCNC